LKLRHSIRGLAAFCVLVRDFDMIGVRLTRTRKKRRDFPYGEASSSSGTDCHGEEAHPQSVRQHP
jgi:hypothetical protein